MTDPRLINTKSERIQSVSVVKGFHLYSRRNEWVNWDGDTNLVRRSYREYNCTLRDAEDKAERMRTPGTRFFIDEFPVVCVKGDRRIVLISELFTDSPLIGYTSNHPRLSNVSNLEDIESSLLTFKWSVLNNYESSAKLTSENGQYFARESSPGKGKNSLVWSLKLRKVDKAGIDKLVDCFKDVVVKNESQ